MFTSAGAKVSSPEPEQVLHAALLAGYNAKVAGVVKAEPKIEIRNMGIKASEIQTLMFT